MNKFKGREDVMTNYMMKNAGLDTLIFILLMLTFAGCGQHQAKDKKFEAPPPEVGILTVTAEDVPVLTELPGRMDAVRVAEVRARATGILLKRMFDEGAEVKAGDVLFQIDPAPLQASFDSAKANLAKAEATLKQAKSRAERYKALVEINAVSKQDYDDAAAAAAQSEAEVQSAKAAAEMASLNLGYATVTSPISGRIGAAKVTEGALVSQAEATQLALIQQLDPIYFDFTQSSTEVLRLKRALDQGELQNLAPDQAKVTLLLEDGTTYQNPGKLLFSDITVDPTTGMITLRAEFPNPQHLLLPGMFARVRIEQAVNPKAITVSQRGVAVGANGSASAMVVTQDDKVESRMLKISSAIKDKWIVTDGLKEGDRVIVEGLQKVRPGMTVKPVPFESTMTNTVKPAQGN